MKFEYRYFLLHAPPFLAEARRAAVLEWFNGLGAEGWDVFHVGPQRDNEAGVIAWAKRQVRG